METKVRREWREESCRLFVLLPLLFFSIHCSFLNPNLLPPLFLLSSTHYPLLALHSSIFSAHFHLSFLLVSFTYCPRLCMIIIFLYLSSHLALGVHSIKTKTHLNSGGIATDTTAACVFVVEWMNPACWKIPHISSVNRQSQKLFVPRVGTLQSAQDGDKSVQERPQNRHLPITEVLDFRAGHHYLSETTHTHTAPQDGWAYLCFTTPVQFLLFCLFSTLYACSSHLSINCVFPSRSTLH